MICVCFSQGPDDILGLGVTGGMASPSGDKPITISYIQPGSAAGRARLKVSVSFIYKNRLWGFKKQVIKWPFGFALNEWAVSAVTILPITD